LRDPLGGMQVTESGFEAMARVLVEIARDHCGGRCAAILEGGYDLQAIRSSAQQVLDGFRSATAPPPGSPTASRGSALIERIRRVQSRYWRL
jgi:acetoin utilization deacetylase AcuC-like enzyme